MQDLQEILTNTISSESNWKHYNIDLKEKLVIDFIYEKADFIISPEFNDDYLVRLEPKIVLSIASRLKVEEFLISILNSLKIKYDNISTNQTRELIKMYEAEVEKNTKISEILEKVLLITSENIHLNSFMYEPLLDISDDELKKLYRDVLKLKNEQTS